MLKRDLVPVAVLGGLVALLAAPAPLAAQDEAALKAFFEGKRVVVRIDMPGTSDGVNIWPDARRALDTGNYRDDLKKYGTAIAAGDSATVTFVKVKSDLIEFQLGGGGFGTFGDDTSTSVSIPLIEKSEREKELEKEIDKEQDKRRRKDLQRELDDLRSRRERQNRRIEAERVAAEEQKRERIANERIRGGSRFNIRYDSVPRGMRPEDVMAALASYVDFGSLDPRAHRADPAGFISETLPRKGMLRAEAERAFGAAISSSDHREGSLRVVTDVYVANGQRIKAEFVEDVLVRYTVTAE